MSYKINNDHIAITDGVDGYFGDARVYTEYGAIQNSPLLGDSYAFHSGGLSSPTTYTNIIEQFPFTTPFTTATDVGDLNQNKQALSGNNSQDNGYTAGGLTLPGSPSTLYTINVIETFPFSTPFTTATDTGDLFLATVYSASQSSLTNGYVSGGIRVPSVSNATIDSFPFTTPFTTATDTGDLIQARTYLVGHSSTTEGYSSGGSSPAISNTIDKFPFSTPFSFATDIGDLTVAMYYAVGTSSTTDGFTSGGIGPPFSAITTAYKFPFSTPLTSSSVGNLNSPSYAATGQQSSAYGYNSGGLNLPNYVNTIERFPFSSSPFTATDVGDLSGVRAASAGQQD